MRPYPILSTLCALALAASASGTSLPDAAEANDGERVLRLLAEGHSLAETQADGMSALHWATYHDDLDTALALLKAGAQANAVTRYGVTPLILACQNGNPALVRALLKSGADPNAALPGGETALMTAARTGIVDPLAALLEAGAEIDAALPNGQTAIMWAVAEGNLEATRHLLDAGAEWQTPLPSGFTPFFFAVRAGHADLVDLFLERGADIAATMEPERNGGKRPETGTTPLILAIENGHLELALELLDRGADPNESRTGKSPLHHLVRVRKPDLGEGAAGEPPPRISGSIDTLEFARELVKRGANVNARIQNGAESRRGRLGTKLATPFFLACDTADLAYMELLLELGADPKLANSDGTTPLMAAAGIGSLAPEEEAGTPEECLAAAKLLVSLGADVNAVDRNGETAMHGAAYKNAPELVRFLHQQGADARIWNSKNTLGWTPLFIAEGYRPGNFKPSFATVDAVSEVMLAQGVPIPTGPRPEHVNYSQ